ncbi:MAG: hypothetical protein COB15_06020 [Flavobacteriales bacterium]|nr:MAG: hypothetical protein COB15_06020 [Flavobacteriales bacterium]
MKYHFETLNITRNNIINAIEGLSLEDLNTVPKGFNNNVIWNVGHVVATQQLLCYKFSGLKMSLDSDFITKYMKGSAADNDISQEEVDYILKQLKVLPAKLENDYTNGVFENYNTYTTSYNITLSAISEAIQFNNVHEGLHFGYIMALKKLIKK